MTHDEMIAVIAAHKEGKRIQIKFKDSDSWDDSQAHWSTAPGFNFDRFDYRVAPEPRLRPWTPEEVPVGAICRLKNCHDCQTEIFAKTRSGLVFVIKMEDYSGCQLEGVSPKYLLEGYEHSTDGGATWKPCGVEE